MMGRVTSALMDGATSIERDLSKQDFEVRQLHVILETKPSHKPTEDHKEPMEELPKISATSLMEMH